MHDESFLPHRVVGVILGVVYIVGMIYILYIHEQIS